MITRLKKNRGSTSDLRKQNGVHGEASDIDHHRLIHIYQDILITWRQIYSKNIIFLIMNYSFSSGHHPPIYLRSSPNYQRAFAPPTPSRVFSRSTFIAGTSVLRRQNCTHDKTSDLDNHHLIQSYISHVLIVYLKCFNTIQIIFLWTPETSGRWRQDGAHGQASDLDHHLSFRTKFLFL